MDANSKNPRNLDNHIQEVLDGNRCFENAFQSVSRMIKSYPINKKYIHGRPYYDFEVFRQGNKHVVGMFDELNQLVAYINDAAQGGSSKEMAFVLIGEPGNGKTFLVNYLCDAYRKFISQPENSKYTFKFKNLEKLGKYGKIKEVESQTFEDPMILAMNLSDKLDENLEYLAKQGFKDKQIDELYKNYRSLGACSDYILNEMKECVGKDIEKLKENIEIVPVPIRPNSGILTGEYKAKDKITTSAADLCGEESLRRLLDISDPNSPYVYDLRRGAIARVAGGGIHFADELFKNKPDLLHIYLGVIQNRIIDLQGYKWPIDTLIIATSNTGEFKRFQEQEEEKPIIDRCNKCFMSHNTNYKLQKTLTRYAIGDGFKKTYTGEDLHEDPNLESILSDSVTLTRMPLSEKLTPIEMRNLAAGEIAGEKSLKTLAEVIDELSRNIDVAKRFGQEGLGHRDLSRSIISLLSNPKTNEGKCMHAKDAIDAVERVILDYVTDQNKVTKYLNNLKDATKLYKEKIRAEIFDAYMDEKDAVKREVKNYINMIVAMEDEGGDEDKVNTYRDPQTKEYKAIKIDRKFVGKVEERLGLKTEEEKLSTRTTLRKIYARKKQTKEEENYSFMDNHELVKAVTDVTLMSDVNSAGSLIGALANQTDKENVLLKNKMISTMKEKLGYCDTCARKTLEYFCTYDDEN